jgi:tetratricopeptide (TPR) repeat protein
VADAATLGRRLADLRRERDRVSRGQAPTTDPGLDGGATEAGSRPIRAWTSGRREAAERAESLAERLSAALDGERIRGTDGGIVRVVRPGLALPIDRRRLATLPGQPGPEVPLVCLDTETTGLATAAGTLAFLVGLGVWHADRFELVQFLLPDHAAEPLLLEHLGASIPTDAWLVTYNGRGFDWPLLVARYRLHGHPAPVHAGHLDLLPFVRRVLRHRLSDARLKTAERDVLGVDRGPDVEGWEVPGRYFDALRGGPVEPLLAVARHNEEDVRTLARLLVHLDRTYGDPERRRALPVGDLVGLAGLFRAERRELEALDCLDAALERPPASGAGCAEPRWARRPTGDPPPRRPDWAAILTRRADEPLARPGMSSGRPSVRGPAAPASRDEVLVERARLLRRLGRHEEALATWRDLAVGSGPVAARAWIEVAKALEHRRRDPAGAFEAAAAAFRIAERSRALGWPLRHLESDLVRRRARLRARLGRRPVSPEGGPRRGPAIADPGSELRGHAPVVSAQR